MIRLVAFVLFAVLPGSAFASAWDVSERQYMLECADKVDGIVAFRSDRYYYVDDQAWAFDVAPEKVSAACNLVRPDPNVDMLRLIDRGVSVTDATHATKLLSAPSKSPSEIARRLGQYIYPEGAPDTQSLFEQPGPLRPPVPLPRPEL